MITIAILSTEGGVGRTSLAVSLASNLAAVGRQVRLLQLDPANTLPVHLGLGTPGDEPGVLACVTGQCLPDEGMLSHDGGFKAMSFGQADLNALIKFDQLMAEQPELLPGRLLNGVEPQELVIIDLPRWPSAACQAVLRLTDLNLVLMAPDTNSALGIDRVLPDLLASRGASYFVMNRFDSSKVLHLDLWTLCKSKLGHRLLPFYLHEDQALPESVAAGVPLMGYAPRSQLVEDHQKLCNWIDSELS